MPGMVPTKENKEALVRAWPDEEKALSELAEKDSDYYFDPATLDSISFWRLDDQNPEGCARISAAYDQQIAEPKEGETMTKHQIADRIWYQSVIVRSTGKRVDYLTCEGSKTWTFSAAIGGQIPLPVLLNRLDAYLARARLD